MWEHQPPESQPAHERTCGVQPSRVSTAPPRTATWHSATLLAKTTRAGGGGCGAHVTWTRREGATGRRFAHLHPAFLSRTTAEGNDAEQMHLGGSVAPPDGHSCAGNSADECMEPSRLHGGGWKSINDAMTRKTNGNGRLRGGTKVVNDADGLSGGEGLRRKLRRIDRRRTKHPVSADEIRHEDEHVGRPWTRFVVRPMKPFGGVPPPRPPFLPFPVRGSGLFLPLNRIRYLFSFL